MILYIYIIIIYNISSLYIYISLYIYLYHYIYIHIYIYIIIYTILHTIYTIIYNINIYANIKNLKHIIHPRRPHLFRTSAVFPGAPELTH